MASCAETHLKPVLSEADFKAFNALVRANVDKKGGIADVRQRIKAASLMVAQDNLKGLYGDHDEVMAHAVALYKESPQHKRDVKALNKADKQQKVVANGVKQGEKHQVGDTWNGEHGQREITKIENGRAYIATDGKQDLLDISPLAEVTHLKLTDEAASRTKDVEDVHIEGDGIERVTPEVVDESLDKAADQVAAIFSSLDSNESLPEAEWLSLGHITQIIDDLTQQFSHEAPIIILDTVGDVDASLIPKSGVVSGMVYRGRIYLFRDGMNNAASVQATLWHELLHYGLRRFLTKEQYIATMEGLYSNDGYIKSEADAWINSEEGKALAKVEVAEYVLARGVDEALAGLASEGLRGDFSNNSIKSKVIRTITHWLSRLAAKLGFNHVAAELAAIPNHDARKLISSVFNKIEHNDKATDADWAFTSDPSFSKVKAEKTIVDENGAHFETGIPVTFNYVHNTQSATSLFGKPNKSSPFGRGYEPSGQYVSIVGKLPDQRDGMIQGSLTFKVDPIVQTVFYRV